MTNEVKKFDELDNVQSLCAIVGLSFSETATDYQKAALLLSHIMLAVRECVLKGRDVTPYLSDYVYNLASLMQQNETVQR